MVFGDAELAFIISSAVMYAFFLPAYYKLCKSSAINAGRKIGYAIIFPSLVIAGILTIFVLHFLMDWGELLVFNGIWALIYVFMLQDLAGSPLMQKLPLGKILLAIGFTLLFIICSAFAYLDVLWFLSLGL